MCNKTFCYLHCLFSDLNFENESIHQSSLLIVTRIFGLSARQKGLVESSLFEEN